MFTVEILKPLADKEVRGQERLPGLLVFTFNEVHLKPEVFQPLILACSQMEGLLMSVGSGLVRGIALALCCSSSWVAACKPQARSWVTCCCWRLDSRRCCRRCPMWRVGVDTVFMLAFSTTVATHCSGE